jgi:DNA-binding NarL/FixJ family response regulator
MKRRIEVRMQEPRSVSILLAEEHALVREGIAAFCESQPQYHVVAQCGEGEQAQKLVESLRPDIALIDDCLPDVVSLELVRRIRISGAQTKTIVLSLRRDRKTVIETLRAGASGFVLKSAPGSQLLDALDQILHGGVYVSPLLDLNKLVLSNSSGRRPADDPIDSLSSREYQVFTLLIEGVRAKEIAARLALSPKTVDTYRASLMRKLDIHDVAGLVKFAITKDLTTTARHA